MPRNRESTDKPAELVPFEPSIEITVLPPNTGVIGRFLEETANMFKAEQ